MAGTYSSGPSPASLRLCHLENVMLVCTSEFHAMELDLNEVVHVQKILSVKISSMITLALIMIILKQVQLP